MEFGLWTPLPHVIRQERRMEAALADLERGDGAHGPDLAFEFAVDAIQRAEHFGFVSTLLAQRYLGPDLEAWTLAAALAMKTKTIELMVAVHPGIMTPQVVAKQAASLDRVSQGRCAINIVNGHWVDEFNLFGNGTWIADPEARYRRMDEFIKVMRGLWTEPHLQIEGEYYQANLACALENKNQKVAVPEVGSIQVRPHRNHVPAIYAASRASSGKRVIAQHCDVWFAEYKPGYCNFEMNLEAIKRDVVDMTAVCTQAGRKLRFGLNPLVVCEDTMAAATSAADWIEDPNNKDRISNSLGAGLVGTPKLIAERICRLQEAGIDNLMLRFTPMEQGLERFGQEVIPLLRG